MQTRKKQGIKIMLYVIAVIWIAVIAQVIVKKSFQDDGKIIEAFAGIDSEVTESKLSAVADYGDKYMTENDKKELIRYIADSIGLNQDYKVSVKRRKTSTVTSAVKKAKNAITSIEVVTIENTKESNAKELKQYVIIDLTIRENVESIVKYKKMIESALDKAGGKDCRTTLKVTGQYNGRMDDTEKERAAQKILNQLQAKMVSKGSDESWYSVYAYTGTIGEYIPVSGKRVNVNIAFDYDEQQNKTNLYLATPILNEDY